MKKAKFYSFNQNNSGGSFHIDGERGMCEYVIVEAESASDANYRAENIGIYFNGCDEGMDCNCCGDRWYSVWNEDDGEDVPSIYGQPIEESSKSLFRDRVFVHYLDGSFKEFKLND